MKSHSQHIDAVHHAAEMHGISLRRRADDEAVFRTILRQALEFAATGGASRKVITNAAIHGFKCAGVTATVTKETETGVEFDLEFGLAKTAE